jgi:hypothetical protein
VEYFCNDDKLREPVGWGVEEVRQFAAPLQGDGSGLVLAENASMREALRANPVGLGATQAHAGEESRP